MVNKNLLSLALILCFLLLSGCAAGSALLPDDVKKKITDEFVYNPKYFRNAQIEITGAGKILPFEKDRGVDSVVCYKVRAEHNVKNDVWVKEAKSSLALRVGNRWTWGAGMKPEWESHSCPGQYELRLPY